MGVLTVFSLTLVTGVHGDPNSLQDYTGDSSWVRITLVTGLHGDPISNSPQDYTSDGSSWGS